ncbi:MAG: RagB/SusD family nutrient uptake outer membrane protein [Flavipsychrobacter sp.]|nr:RagB/SusD family nutrient uptake outer membrane protein [Flavipsychrobacter sp.]
MKKQVSHYSYLPFLLLTILISSCSRFLDVEPRASVSDQVTITDKISAEQAVRGIYSAFADGSYYGTSFVSIGYLSGDNVQWTGSQSQVQEFINHQVSAENSTLSAAWSAIYRAINRANNVLEKLPVVTDPQLTENLKNQYLGEASFLRALAYFDLVRTWGGVPIITTSSKEPSDNAGIPRSSEQEVWALIAADLDRAEQLLPLTTDRFRATRKTVYALKSRYHLYRQSWEEAGSYATLILDDNTQYELLSSYGAFFTNNARGTSESVFELFYNGTTEINSHRNQWQPQINGGTRQWAPSAQLIAFLNDPATGGNRSVLIARDNQNRWYGNLYYRNPASDPSYIIRTAELFLIRAEAFAQLGKPEQALSDLNKVRLRAGLVALESDNPDFILGAIESERRLEFAFEPHRWFDLVRTGRALTVLNIQDANKLKLPIPASQLLIDKALEQNPGY